MNEAGRVVVGSDDAGWSRGERRAFSLRGARGKRGSAQGEAAAAKDDGTTATNLNVRRPRETESNRSPGRFQRPTPRRVCAVRGRAAHAAAVPRF